MPTPSAAKHHSGGLELPPQMVVATAVGEQLEPGQFEHEALAALRCDPLREPAELRGRGRSGG